MSGRVDVESEEDEISFSNLFVNLDGTNLRRLPKNSLLGTVQTVHKTVLLYRFSAQIGKA